FQVYTSETAPDRGEPTDGSSKLSKKPVTTPPPTPSRQEQVATARHGSAARYQSPLGRVRLAAGAGGGGAAPGDGRRARLGRWRTPATTTMMTAASPDTTPAATAISRNHSGARLGV